ncbi:hypothetical protein INT45_005258 [Circinella minor]|uniref:Uncharacterized protein n=1 Tax=Circinella minor TaxID=1195481 RepID=A0A8H7V7G9_9FUNG|nr:hypothetical protein INT45_005258 [Circinella minor]
MSSDSSAPTSAATTTSSTFAVSGKKNKGKKRADTKHCRLHGPGRHSSKECRALASLQTNSNAGKVAKFAGSSSGARAAGSSGGSSSSGKKNYFKCGFVPWKQGHICEVNHLAIRSASIHQSPSSSSSVSGSIPVTLSPPSSSAPMMNDASTTSARPESAPTTSSATQANEDILMAEVEDSLTKACFNWT